MTKISNQYSLTNILTADLANSRLGINNVSPTVALDVTGAGKFSSTIFVNAPLNNTVITTSDATNITNGFNLLGSSSYWGIRTSTSGDFKLDVYGAGATKNALSIAQSTGAATFSRNDAVNVSVTIANAYLNQGNLINFQQNKAGSTINAYIGHGGDSSGNFIINNGTQALTITSTGNVGIGTTSPVGRLDIQETATNTYGIISLRGNNRGSEIDFYQNSTLCNTIYSDGTTNNLIFATGTGVTERMRINSTGNVGIGTSAPGYKLEVNGTGYFSSTLSAGGTISGNNISTGGTLTGAYLSVGSAVYTYNVTTYYYGQNFAFTVPNALNSGSDNSAMRMYMVWVWGANGVTEAGCKVWMVAMNGGGTAYTANEILGRDANGGTGLSIARTSASQLTISSNNNAYIKFVSIMQLMTY